MVLVGVASVVTSYGDLCLRGSSARTVASRPTSSAATRCPTTVLQTSRTSRVSVVFIYFAYGLGLGLRKGSKKVNNESV